VQWGVLTFLVVAASSGYAQDLNQIRAPVETVRAFLTGPFAVTMAGIAVAAVGYLYWIGRIDKDVAVSVVIGIGIVFGSQQIVTTLSQAVGR
jgi:type IV secretion system protein VirB2